ncbi:hypothetical protein BKI52_40370 [marine bacterium AO1-C]|nr:hypothetical protein BKI52_40370 [marine bacterium AO1-C]
MLTLLAPLAKAQETTGVFKIGTTRLDANRWVEVLGGFGSYNTRGIVAPNWGLAAGVEIGGDEISPKISLGATWGVVFTSSLNLNYYPKRNHRLVVTPEIGLNIVKLFHFTYGYQINQVNRFEGGPPPTRHRFSVFITIPSLVLW